MSAHRVIYFIEINGIEAFPQGRILNLIFAQKGHDIKQRIIVCGIFIIDQIGLILCEQDIAIHPVVMAKNLGIV